jgi:tight adherence protein B
VSPAPLVAGALAALSAVLAVLALEGRTRPGVLVGVAPAVEPTRKLTLDRLAAGAREHLPVGASATIGFLIGGVVGSAVGAGAGLLAERLIERRRIAAEKERRNRQLPDAVRTMTSALRAGMSLPQAIRYAADEAREPIAIDLAGVVDRIDVGVPLTDALEEWAASADTDDVRLVVGVLDLHRRSGGDLPAVLDRVSAMLRDRAEAAGEVRALTAQGRLSGVILGVLPVGFFAFLWLTSRRDIEGAFQTPAGWLAVGVGLGLEGLAFLWIRRLLVVTP